MIPVIKKEKYQIKIDSVASDGSGVGHIQGFTVFVPMSVSGDVAEVEITKVKRRFACGKLIRVIEPSPRRRQSPCPYFGRCGGCQFQHIEYDAQANIKKKIIEDAMRRIGGISDFSLDKFIAADSPFRYRNKVVFQAQGKVCGFFEPSSRDIVNTDDCLLCDEDLIKVKTAVTRYIRECGAMVKRIFARRSSVGEVMAVISADSGKIPYPERLIEYLKDVDNIKSVYLNVDKSGSSTVMRGEYTLLWGRERLNEDILGVKFTVSPQSFFQINYEQMKRLYETALSFADISPEDTVMDIYCGTGTISLAAALRAKQVIGVEKVEEAILDAKANAKMNGIYNAEFYASAAADIVPQMADSEIDIVILDPPRAGSDTETLGAILKMAPKRVVYISCDPSTLARDVRLLSDGGYGISASAGVDMFPQTTHVETVVLLSHKKPDTTISVKVEFGEGEGKVPLDKIAERAENYKPKERVTYKMIKEYIEAKYDFKVHTAYIAEVKRDLGLPMYDAPNAVEELKQPRKHPTPEKVEAIKDALKHYEII